MSGQDHKGQEPVYLRIFPLPPIVLLLFIASGYVLQQLIPMGGGKPAIASVIAGNALMVIGFMIALLGAWKCRGRKRRFILEARRRRSSPRAFTAERAIPCM